MATWAELNQAAGGQATAPVPSAAQSGGWAAANAQAVQAIGASYVPASSIPVDRSIEQNIKSSLPEDAFFIENATISAPPASNKKFELLGVRINRPTSLYGTESGQPIIDVDPDRFEARASEDAGFLRKMAATGINTIGQSILGISESFSNLFEIGIVDNVTEGKDISLNESGTPVLADGTPVLYPGVRERLEQGLPAQPTGAEKVGATISAGAAVAGGAFTPVAVQLEMARELPVIGKPVFGTILKGFELLDHASRFVGTKFVDVLPVDDQSREVLRQPIEDLAGIVGTLFGVKAIHTVGAKGGGRVVDALPVSEGTKGQIRGGVQLGAGVALEPFTVAYRGIATTIRSKTEARQAAGEQITPDTARTIVNETVKQVRTPDIEAIMEVPTTEGRTRVYTNQKLVLENLIKGREDLNYKRVDDLGIQLKTDTPITSRFEWDYAKQQGTIYTTSKTTAVDLARELGHYVDRQLGATLSTRLSEVLPEYRQNRDQINQLLADYALNRLDGNATHKEINAEIVKIADNIKSEIESVRETEARQRPAQEFAQAVGDIINDPLKREASPELAQLIEYSIGRDVARKGKADVVGEAGSREAAESILGTLEKSKREQLKRTRTEDEGFYNERLKDETERQRILEQGEGASANFDWQQISKALRDSAEFRKEKTLTDRTFDGVLMEKNGKFRVVPLAEVKKMQRNGWESRYSMDEIAHANGFESAETYSDYIMKLDADLRDLGRTSEQRAAHEYLLKNDENYAKLEETINNFRERLKEGEETVYEAERTTGQVDRTAPIEQKVAGEAKKATETVKTERKAEPKQEVAGSETVQRPTRKGVSKVGDSIAKKVVEQKLEDSYKGTAEFERINIKDQAERVQRLINSDLDQAKRIMRGEEQLPDGLRAGSLIKGMEEYALRTGDVELAFELANSKLISETSIHAQEMRLLAERSPDSATARLQEVKKARLAEAQKALRQGETVEGNTKKALNELQNEIKKTRPKKEDWSSFIESIKC